MTVRSIEELSGEERLAYIDRGLQELAGTLTIADIAGTLYPAQIIARQVEEAARAILVMRNLVRVNRDLVGSPGDTLRVPKRGTVTAFEIAEGAEITKVEPDYTAVDIKPTKFGLGIAITYEAIQASQFNLINDFITEAGYALAKREDSEILNDFYDTTEHPDILTASAATPGVLSYDDCVAMVGRIRAENWDPDTIVIHPDQLVDLLKDTKFINASAYGGREPLLQGEIGRFAGCQVFVSSQATSGQALIFDRKRASILVQKRDVTVRRDEKPERDRIELYFTQMYKPYVINEKAVGIITGC